MKILSWMQSKLYGRHSSQTISTNPTLATYHREEHCKEEFSDWPHALLAIGTFGTNKKIEKSNLCQENIEKSKLSQESELSAQGHHLQDLTAEEVGRLQDELERIIEDEAESNCCDDDSQQQHNTSMVPSKSKDVCSDGKKGVIGKRSLSFLLKKTFVCASGFAPVPTPSPREHHFPESRMEKIMRAILHKKIYPQTQSCSAKVGGKKYLEGKDDIRRRGQEEEKRGSSVDDGSKWVKTDSEYIVLEI